MTTPTQGKQAQAEALIEIAREIEALKRPCGMDPESATAVQNGRYMAIAYKVREIAAQVAALTAQPAAPQGAAYAELPDGSGNPNIYADPPAKHLVHEGARFYNFHQLRDFADRTHALRASNGQAPAGVIGWVHPDWRADQGRGRIYGHNPGGYVALVPAPQTDRQPAAELSDYLRAVRAVLAAARKQGGAA